MFSYSIGITMQLLILWGIYKLLLARTSFYRFNRAALLMIYFLALLAIPVIQAIPTAAPTYTINLNVVEIAEQPNALAESDNTWLLSHILPYLYIAGVVLTAATMLISLLRIALLIKSSKRIKHGDFTIAIHNCGGIVPFSWGKWVIISSADYEDGGEYIISHELSHLRSRHWLDLLIAQIAIIINWFNPAAWLMRYELQDVHEYAADEAVIKSKILSPEQYQLFLIKKTAGARFAAIANSLNHSSLKKRITMMLSKKSHGAARMRALAFVPAAALALIFVSKPIETIAASAEVSETVELLSKDTKKNYNVNEVDQMAEFPEAKPLSTNSSVKISNSMKMPKVKGGGWL